MSAVPRVPATDKWRLQAVTLSERVQRLPACPKELPVRTCLSFAILWTFASGRWGAEPGKAPRHFQNHNGGHLAGRGVCLVIPTSLLFLLGVVGVSILPLLHCPWLKGRTVRTPPLVCGLSGYTARVWSSTRPSYRTLL